MAVTNSRGGLVTFPKPPSCPPEPGSGVPSHSATSTLLPAAWRGSQRKYSHRPWYAAVQLEDPSTRTTTSSQSALASMVTGRRAPGTRLLRDVPRQPRRRIYTAVFVQVLWLLFVRGQPSPLALAAPAFPCTGLGSPQRLVFLRGTGRSDPTSAEQAS